MVENDFYCNFLIRKDFSSKPWEFLDEMTHWRAMDSLFS